MILICRPKGKGNWTKITIVVNAPADLFPALRNQPVTVGMVIRFAGLALRVCEVKS